MGLIDEIIEGKTSTIIIIILGVLVFHLYFTRNTKETMADVSTTDQIKDAVKQVYLADVEAIRNLSNVATQLQTSGLTIPGQLKVADKISTNNLDPTNMPDGWTGGLRILDGYSSGTMGFGPDGKKLNAYINSKGDLMAANAQVTNINTNTGTVNGDFKINGNLNLKNDTLISADGDDKTHWVRIRQTSNPNQYKGLAAQDLWSADSVFSTKLCLGGTCIDESHLQMLTGARGVALKHVSGAWGNHMDMPWLHVDANRNLTKWYDSAANFAFVKN